MDYKGLIDRLNAYSAKYQCHGGITAEAADAIKTILAERDAALEELRGICWCCAYGEKWDKAPAWSKMATCKYMREQGVLAISGGKRKCKHWEWRGVRKQD